MAQVSPRTLGSESVGQCDTCQALVPLDSAKAHAQWHENLRQIGQAARHADMMTRPFGGGSNGANGHPKIYG